MGAALLLGGCGSHSKRAPQAPSGLMVMDPARLTPEQFEALVGTVEDARENAARGIESSHDFLQRFITHSPRIHVAGRADGVIGSVFYNPRPAALASAVRLQLARDRVEPALLHNDLGGLAALQYAKFGASTFAAIYPNWVSLIGDSLHRNRSILQLVVYGNLPSTNVVLTNQDLESLIGRELTFAEQIVRGARCGSVAARIRSSAIWTEETAMESMPEGAVSLSLLRDLVHLEIAAREVRTITPTDPQARAQGWQAVSDTYRNFAVGQFIETAQTVAEHTSHNGFEKSLMALARDEYGPYQVDIKKRLDWNQDRDDMYQVQKEDGRTNLTAQPAMFYSKGA